MTTYLAHAPRLSGQAAHGALGALERSIMSLSWARLALESIECLLKDGTFLYIRLGQLALIAVDRLSDCHQERGASSWRGPRVFDILKLTSANVSFRNCCTIPLISHHNSEPASPK